MEDKAENLSNVGDTIYFDYPREMKIKDTVLLKIENNNSFVDGVVTSCAKTENGYRIGFRCRPLPDLKSPGEASSKPKSNEGTPDTSVDLPAKP
jgi:hypothetical protein